MSEVKNIPLPACMMPDGADPCESYRLTYERMQELQGKIEKMNHAISETLFVFSNDLQHYPNLKKLLGDCL